MINGFAENIEHHSKLIHDFFNENKEVFLKDEKLRDEFFKRQQENRETIKKFIKSIEDEFIGRFIMIDNSDNFPNINNKGYYKIIGVYATTYDAVFGFGISLLCSGFDVVKPENFGKMRLLAISLQKDIFNSPIHISRISSSLQIGKPTRVKLNHSKKNVILEMEFCRSSQRMSSRKSIVNTRKRCLKIC